MKPYLLPLNWNEMYIARQVCNVGGNSSWQCQKVAIQITKRKIEITCPVLVLLDNEYVVPPGDESLYRPRKI